jgi:oligopeptide transport system permease protein
MLSFALRRLLVAIPTLFALLALSFFLMHAAPGGPFDRERDLPPEVEQRLRAEYHLDEPVAAQFGRYLARVACGDLGPSFQYPGVGVTELIAAGAPASAMLGGAALCVATLIGVALGLLAALHRGEALDRALMLFAIAGISVPAYVTAPLLILLFAVTLGWLPAGGWGGVGAMVLPALALAAPQVATIARLTRASALEVLAAPFIRTARAKGLSERAVILRHALKPALLPVVSYLGPAAAGLVTGSVVIEQIFGIPGIGRHFVQGALNRDYTLVLGVVLFYGALVIAFNFLVDLAYGAIDPRLRQV